MYDPDGHLPRPINWGQVLDGVKQLGNGVVNAIKSFDDFMRNSREAEEERKANLSQEGRIAEGIFEGIIYSKAASGEKINPVETYSFNSPASRHYYSKVTQSSVAKELNTIIMPGVNVSADVSAINAGKAVRSGNTFSINGRTYGMHDGALYPMSGDGFVTLDRGAYKALGVYKKFGEDNIWFGKM